MSKESLHVKIDSDLKKALQKEAEKQNRTTANLVETILKQYMEK